MGGVSAEDGDYVRITNGHTRVGRHWLDHGGGNGEELGDGFGIFGVTRQVVDRADVDGVGILGAEGCVAGCSKNVGTRTCDSAFAGAIADPGDDLIGRM